MEATQSYKPSPVNHAMLFGLELGIWYGLNFIISAMSAGRLWMNMLSWLVVFYIIYGIYRSAVHYRQTECGGRLGYFQSFSYIMWLVFFASVIGAVVKVVYLKWVNPEYLGELYVQTQQMVGQLSLQGVDPETFNASLEKMMQPVRFSLYYIVYDLIAGLFLSLMISIFVAKKGKS